MGRLLPPRPSVPQATQLRLCLGGCGQHLAAPRLLACHSTHHTCMLQPARTCMLAAPHTFACLYHGVNGAICECIAPECSAVPETWQGHDMHHQEPHLLTLICAPLAAEGGAGASYGNSSSWLILEGPNRSSRDRSCPASRLSAPDCAEYGALQGTTAAQRPL